MKLKLVIFLLCAFQFAMTQQPVSIHITERDGLPDNEIYSILEDQKGNVWIAGNKGLFKYNGKEFVTFSHAQKQGRSFFGLKMDDNGRVWCNNIAGQFFYIENDKLKLFGDYQNLLKGSLSDFEFFDNNLVFQMYDKSEKTPKLGFVNLKTKRLKSSKFFKIGTSIGAQFNSKYYYINPGYKLSSIDGVDAKVSRVSDQKVSKDYWFTQFIKSKDHIFINISDANHINTSIFQFNGKLQKLTLPKLLLDIRIEHILFTNNTFYISTSNGVFVVYSKHNKLSISAHYLDGIFITKTIKDKNGNLWLSTLNEGIYVIPNESLKQIDNTIKISVLKKKNDSVCFVGTENGRFLEYNNFKNTFATHPLSAKATVRAIDYNHKKNVLLFASDQNMYVTNTNKNGFKNLSKTGGIKSLSIIDTNKYLVSASHASLVKTQTKETTLNEQRAYVSHYSKKTKNSYVSDVDGLKVYDQNFKLVKQLTYKKSPIYTFAITETKNGTLFLATYDNGVLVLKNDNVIDVLNIQNGLASNVTNTVKADADNLWIATEAGLQFYDTTSKQFKTITRQDGLESYTINQIEILGNTVLIASNLGFFSFDKSTIFRNRELSKPYISSVNINEADTLVTANYNLKQTESAIRFQFNTVGFQSNKFTDYQYKLTDFNDDWVTVEDGSDYVKFTALPAGNFQFNLRAKNKFSDSYKNAEPILISVILPFYKTWWFLGAVFLALLVLIIWFYNQKTKRLKKQQKIELEKAEISKDLVFSQLENLRSQMNPHFIFNALNSIQDYIILNEQSLARQYLIKFSRLIRIYLEHSQQDTIFLSEEMKALKLYLELEKDRFNDDFEYDISVDKSLDVEKVLVPSLFIQPYAENALKHGLLHVETNKKLKISFKKDATSNMMFCTIEDNGIGREASAKINAKRHRSHKSFATSANQKRIDLLNMANNTKLNIEIIDLYDDANIANGTKIILKIPI